MCGRIKTYHTSRMLQSMVRKERCNACTVLPVSIPVLRSPGRTGGKHLPEGLLHLPEDAPCELSDVQDVPRLQPLRSAVDLNLTTEDFRTNSGAIGVTNCANSICRNVGRANLLDDDR